MTRTLDTYLIVFKYFFIMGRLYIPPKVPLLADVGVPTLVEVTLAVSSLRSPDEFRARVGRLMPRRDAVWVAPPSLKCS